MANKRKKNTPLVMLVSIVSVALMMSIKSTFIFFLIGVLPAIVASFSDVSHERKHYKAVALCNLAGISPYIGELIASGNTSEKFFAMLIQPKIWFAIYCFAGVGWVLIWIGPKVCEALIRGMQKGKILRIEIIQKKLIQEWGNTIQDR